MLTQDRRPAASSHLPYGKELSRAGLQSQQDVALNIIRTTRRSVWPRSANGTQPALAGRRPAEILARRRRNAGASSCHGLPSSCIASSSALGEICAPGASEAAAPRTVLPC